MVDLDSPQIPLSADGHEEDAEIKIYSGLCEVRHAVDTLWIRWKLQLIDGLRMPVSDICDYAMEDDNSFGQSCATTDNWNFPYVVRYSAHGSIDG